MINPTNIGQTVDVRQPAQPAAEVKPDIHAQAAPVPKSGALSHDQVTLRSAGQQDEDVDRD